MATGSFFHLVINAAALALLLLRTHTAAHCGQGACGAEHGGSATEVAAFNVFYESRNVDVDRASLDALRIGTVHASGGLEYGLLAAKPLIDLLIAGYAVGRVEFRHLHAGYVGTLFCGVGFAQLLAPLGIARSYLYIV